MRFFLPQAIFLLAGTAALAAPTENGAAADNVGVYVTTDWDWGNREKSGIYQMFWSPPGTCVDLTGTGFDKQVSSFGPERWVKCTVFADGGCRPGRGEPSEALVIVHPGYARLASLGAGGNANWDNRISSFRCEWGGPGSAV